MNWELKLDISKTGIGRLILMRYQGCSMIWMSMMENDIWLGFCSSNPELPGFAFCPNGHPITNMLGDQRFLTDVVFFGYPQEAPPKQTRLFWQKRHRTSLGVGACWKLRKDWRDGLYMIVMSTEYDCLYLVCIWLLDHPICLRSVLNHFPAASFFRFSWAELVLQDMVFFFWTPGMKMMKKGQSYRI